MSSLSKENILGVGSVYPLIFKMSIPPMFSMMIQSLYNIIDSMYVASISSDALMAVSIVFPIQNVILAVSVGFGIGLGSVMARSIGSNDINLTNKVANHGIILTIILSIIFVISTFTVVDQYVSAYAINANVLQLGKTYGYIIMSFSFAMLFGLYFEKIFQSRGNMIIAMVSHSTGAIVNIILDPILIFGYLGAPELGVSGAAIATVTGQVLSLAIMSVYFVIKEKEIKINLKGFVFDFNLIKNIFSVAVPSSLIIAIPSIFVSLLNGILLPIEPIAVNVLGVYMKMQTFAFMPISGLVQGIRPIIGFNYGANKISRMYEVVKKSLVVGVLIMLAMTLLFWIMAEPILYMFDADDTMLELGVSSLKIISLGFILMAITTVLASFFESLGYGLYSLSITVTKQLLVLVGLAFFLAPIIGPNGVWVSFPIGEFVGLIVSLFFLRKVCNQVSKIY